MRSISPERIECDDVMQHSPAAYSEQDRQMVAEFDVQMLLPIGMTIVVFAIGIAYGLNVLEDTQTDLYNENAGIAGCNATHKTACGAAYNATGDGITAVAKFPDKLGLIVTVIIAAVVIGILVRYLFVRYG